MDTALRDNYVGNRSWFQASTHGKDWVLCRSSALEFLGLFGGYLNSKQIEVYSKEPTDYDNVEYKLVDSFDDLSTVNLNDVRCTCVNQTINDMLSDFDNIDEQALVESLATYYFLHNDSFNGLSIDPENHAVFDSIKDWAIDYYNEE